MRQIHRMAYSRTNSCGDQPLLTVIGAHLRKPSELCPAEVRSRSNVEIEAGRKERDGGNPTPWCGIEEDIAPVPGQRSDADPHRKPRRHEHAKWRPLTLAPPMR